MKHSSVIVISLACLCGAGVGIGVNAYQSSRPLYTTGKEVADAAKAGNPEYAEQRARELYPKWQQCYGDLGEIRFDMTTLPDQKYAENPDNRRANTTAWTFPIYDPEYSSVAFYTDLYARRNRSYYKGDKSEAHPTGFFLVMWKDGKLERIPTSKLRMLNNKDGHGVTVWPGLPGYEHAHTNIHFGG